MRKRVIGQESAADGSARLDLVKLAQVELTSEDPGHPIEAALRGTPPGWRAAQPGKQIIRLLFDQPQRIRQVGLVFVEESRPRTQEFALRCSLDGGESYREVVRQQYNFSPPGTTRQEERYSLDLEGVTAIELRIIPALGDDTAIASLADLFVA